ncbi:hypothetical protein [uncultured Brachybacterium sp.]|uniref:hypothetical protein n=1 Tax=uncultured Brachybacterium sp. TaxID=189680 RepID=UPI0026374ACF|nr:hypothetical protein [uncultured Brachybacterium sp.]
MPEGVVVAVIGLVGVFLGAMVSAATAALNLRMSSKTKAAELRQKSFEIWAVKRFDVHSQLIGELESALQDTQSRSPSWMTIDEHLRWSRRARLIIADLRLLSSDDVSHAADLAVSEMELAMHLGLSAREQVDEEFGHVLSVARSRRDDYVGAARAEAKSGPDTTS